MSEAFLVLWLIGLYVLIEVALIRLGSRWLGLDEFEREQKEREARYRERDEQFRRSGCNP